MATNQELAPAAGSKFKSIEDILRDPTTKAELASYVDEAVIAKTKIATQQQNIKATRDIAVEQLGIKPALFNSYVAMAFNNDYVQRKDKLDEQMTLLDMVMSDANLTYTTRAGDDE